MKARSRNHRTKNTFKFQGFYEKLKEIKLSSRKYLVQKLESDDDGETFLVQTIRKWAELNRTQGFQDFQSALGQDIQTINQLLLNEKHIVKVFKASLKASDNLVLSPLLHSLVAFARDIPDKFYNEYFYIFLPLLISIASSHPKCHETIENVFVSIVSLFTLLRKYFQRDFSSVSNKAKSFHKFYVKTGFCSLFSKKYPWYINELAAQSFGTLLRNFSNEIKKSVFAICLKRLNDNNDSVEGVGRIIFNSIKLDVSRRLHSSCYSTFSLLLDVVLSGDVPQEESTQSLVFCLRQLSFHITASIPGLGWQDSWKEDSDKIWSPLFNKFREILISIDPSDISSLEPSLISVLRLVRELVQCKNTSLVIDFDTLLSHLSTLLKFLISDDVASLVNDIVTEIYLSPNCEKLSHSLHQFSSSFFASSVSFDIKLNFIKSVLNSSIFDTEILNIYLQYIDSVLLQDKNNEVSLKVLSSVSTIITSKAFPVRSAFDLNSWSEFPLQEGTEMNNVTRFIEILLTNGLFSDMSNLESLIKCCIVIPHFRSLKKPNISQLLICIMNQALQMVQKNSHSLIRSLDEPRKKKRKSISSNFNFSIGEVSEENSRKLMFLISLIVEVLYHTSSIKSFVSLFPNTFLINLLKEYEQYRGNIHLLKVIDIYVTALHFDRDTKVLNKETLLVIYQLLGPLLSCHRPLVRQLVAHILSLFSCIMLESNNESNDNLFAIMFEVEMSVLSPLDFKERLRLLSKLGPDNCSLFEPFEVAPLFFLLGQLYINFKDIWPVTKELISNWASHLDEDLFWSVWLPQVQLASHFAMRNLCDKRIEYESATIFDDSSIQELHSSLITHPGYSHFNIEPDYMNYRDLLWQCMQKFPSLCERRNKDIVSSFLDFLHYELFPVDYDVAPTQDISLKNQAEDLSMHISKETEDNAVENDMNNDELSPHKRVRKASIKSLCEHLSLFAKFRNPKVVYKSKELESIYCEFLSHPYGKAQKLALDCLFAYNYAFLIPYRESLYNILDPKTFRSEIALFDLEGHRDDLKSLREDHRSQFMPYLMRIMYGKMLSRITRGSGKLDCATRRSIVLRFLAGSKESELDTFLELTFDFMLNYLGGSVFDVVKRVEENLDLTKVVPLRRMQGVLGTLESILTKLNFMIKSKREFLLKVILFVLSISSKILERRDQVSDHYSSQLKTIRQVSMLRLVTYFNIFDDYKWSDDDIEAVFSAAVWPVLTRLPDEGIYSATPLLKLFSCWSQNKLFHILLARHYENDQSLTPFPYIIKLINHPKCSKGVINTVYEIIGHLLGKGVNGEKVEEGEEDEVSIEEECVFLTPLKNILPLKENVEHHGLSQLSIGESIILYSMNGILDNIKNSLVGISSKHVVKKLDISMLTLLAGWITNEKDAQQILNAIVPILRKHCIKKQEQAVNLLNICCNLLKVTRVKKFNKDFLSMFSLFNDREARSSLCEVIEVIYTNSDEKDTLASWCSELNAWKKEAVDEIDGERRMKCYWKIKSYLDTTNKFNEELIIFLFRQNLWIINHSTDQSLRTLAVICLENVFSCLVRIDSHSRLKFIFEYDVISLIKNGLTSDDEGIRDSVLTVLGHAVRKCSSYHHFLLDLHALSDVSDPDCDFFANMSHLQRSRRARTLFKLSEGLRNAEYNMQYETLNDFILPIATAYLFRDEYTSDSYLIDGAVSCLGSIASKLPWNFYESLLKRYLNLVSHDVKQLRLRVRVLESIIDAFHEEVSEVEDSKLISGYKKSRSKSDNKVSKSLVSENVDDDGGCKIFHDEPSEKSKEIYFSLTRSLIPQIEKTLAQKSTRDSEHKVNKKRFPEDGDIKRIPLAFALVKLLKKLPPGLLYLKVNGILMKLISYLKSKAESIRREARNMLVKVMIELGGNYLPYLVKDMGNILDKGYQTHVLIFTLHSILINLQSKLVPRNISDCLGEIMNICLEDLFGSRAEEKGISKLTSKVKEMRSDKGYSIMGIIAQAINVEDIAPMMLPIKEKLRTHDAKVVNKIINCLQKISNGLERNINLTVEHKSILVYGILTEKIKDLSASKEDDKELKEMTVKPDCFLIEEEPRKIGSTSQIDQKTTSHALVEFALNLLYHLIRKGHFSSTSKQHIALLDPYVPLLADCLLSEYPETSIQALNVFGCLLRYPLTSMKGNIEKITVRMFFILNKFASSSLVKGKIFELVQLTFKIMAQMIKDIAWYNLQLDHCKILLCYATNNLEDYNLYHSSFIILNALIARKVNTEELHELLATIKDLSVLSTNMNMLDQARGTFYRYITTYPKKKKQYKEILLYYLWNISYSIPAGRMSSALMLSDLISKFDRSTFDQSLETTIWFKLSSQLVVENESEQKIILRKVLKKFFSLSCRKNFLIDKCVEMIDNDGTKTINENAVSIHVGSQSLLSMLDLHYDENVSSIFNALLPRLNSLLHPSRFSVSDDAEALEIDTLDLSLNSLLELLIKLMDVFLKKHSDKLLQSLGEDLWKYVQSHLLYPNIQVRLNASLVLGRLFSIYPSENSRIPNFISTSEQIHSLLIDFCEQLNTECPLGSSLLVQLGLAIVRNLIYLVRQSCKVQLNKQEMVEIEKIPELVLDGEDAFESTPLSSNALWVLHRVGVIAYSELREKPRDSTFKRECLLNLIAGIVVVLGDDFPSTTRIVSFIIHHVTRELSDKRLPDQLSARTQEVANLVKDRIGHQRYTEDVMRAQENLQKKRYSRKARSRELLIANPEIAAKKRAKKNVAKKLSKKRKLTELKLKPSKKNLRNFVFC